MTPITRYRPLQHPMLERDDGEYVLYADYARLEALLQSVTMERDHLISVNKQRL